MVKKEDFIWKKHFVNNIETNPLEYYYCIIDTGKGARRYAIQPQYPSEKTGLILDTKNPEYYILFEDIGKKATEEERKNHLYQYNNLDGYIFDGKGLVRVFKTLEDAKERACVQYSAIYGYALNYIGNTEEITQNHFVVK